MSGRKRPASTKPHEPAPVPGSSEEPTQVPRVETPTGDIELRQIWYLLREMQQQVVSLQESVGTVGQNLIEVEGTINRINNVTTGVAERLDRLEVKPHTPERETTATGTDETPQPPIHSPTARRPHERSALLGPAAPIKTTSRTDFFGNPLPFNPSRTTRILGEGGQDSARTSPEQKPIRTAPSSPAPNPPQSVKPPKMKEPDEFDGTKGKVARQWITKATYWAFTQLPNYNNSKEAMVMRLLSLMKIRPAADWAQPHFEAVVGSKRGRMTSIREFIGKFEQAFMDPDAARVAARQLESLKQEGSVTDYNTQFNNLRAAIDWNEPALQSQYDRGLQPRVKSQLRFVNLQPTTLEELQEAAIKIGNLFAELDASRPHHTSGNTDKKGKGRDTPSSTTASKSDVKSSLPNYVEKEERDARRKEGLSIKCGAPDHTFKQCKNGYSVKCLSTNKGAETKEVKKESGKVGEIKKVTVEEEEESEESGKE